MKPKRQKDKSLLSPVTANSRYYFLEVASELCPEILTDLRAVYNKHQKTLEHLVYVGDDQTKFSDLTKFSFDYLASLVRRLDHNPIFHNGETQVFKDAKTFLKDLRAWRRKYHLWTWVAEIALASFWAWPICSMSEDEQIFYLGGQVSETLDQPGRPDFKFSYPESNPTFEIKHPAWRINDMLEPHVDTWESYEAELRKLYKKAKAEFIKTLKDKGKKFQETKKMNDAFNEVIEEYKKQRETYFDCVAEKVVNKQKGKLKKHFKWAALRQISGYSPEKINAKTPSNVHLGKEFALDTIVVALKTVFDSIDSSPRKLGN